MLVEVLVGLQLIGLIEVLFDCWCLICLVDKLIVLARLVLLFVEGLRIEIIEYLWTVHGIAAVDSKTYRTSAKGAVEQHAMIAVLVEVVARQGESGLFAGFLRVGETGIEAAFIMSLSHCR